MLINKIQNDTKQAMLNKEKAKLSTLRLLIAKLEKTKVALKLSNVNELTDEQVQSVINKNIKELDKEMESYIAVGRTTESQETEKEVLLSYLPKQLTKQEITDIVKEVMIVNESLGMVMAELSSRLKGKADMKLVSQIVKELRK